MWNFFASSECLFSRQLWILSVLLTSIVILIIRGLYHSCESFLWDDIGHLTKEFCARIFWGVGKIIGPGYDCQELIELCCMFLVTPKELLD